MISNIGQRGVLPWRGLVTALVAVAALMLAPAQASAAPVGAGSTKSTTAASVCPLCQPPNAPPPKCIPQGQHSGSYYWEYLRTKTWTGPTGHGWRVHEYLISAEWSLISRKVTCKINF
ncbi:hypothetical protein [Microlunatus parietis]|uniref:Uncharacterized protein n=1 Tax=Microlunatus parietis TaxID=682979 RepID=A0A7Y9I863_9ACTN|nr:hypothetical protein [Microlunatus parietis]NYE71845.1 hypothetical protein [Microlunatus parietis]